MKRIIALRGKSNTGKTTTLKIFLELLKCKYSPLDPDLFLDEKDIRGIYSINGKKNGIETHGDTPKRLGKSLEIFKNEGCQLIVCACRSKGETIETVKALKPDYILSFRGQSAVSQKDWRGKSNSQIAKLILEEAESVINQ